MKILKGQFLKESITIFDHDFEISAANFGGLNLKVWYLEQLIIDEDIQTAPKILDWLEQNLIPDLSEFYEEFEQASQEIRWFLDWFQSKYK
jgi:hypothetical protein